MKRQCMNWQDYIQSDEKVLMGKPAIKGTRLSVEFLLGWLANGWTEQQLLENYLRLTKESLQAIYAFAQECLKDNLLLHPAFFRKAS